MSNILTDILGLNSQKKYKENPLAAKDVFVIGDVDVPRMVGISSPIPIKDEKLVTFYDLALSVIGLLRIENVGPGAELVIPPAQTGNPFLWNVRTLTSQDGTVSIVEGGDTVDFAAVFSTDVHPIGFTYNQTTHEVTIEQNSAPGPIQFLTVDLDNLATEVLDEGGSVETNVTQIDFVGLGVQAASTGPGTVQVNIDGQDIHQLMTNNIFYRPLRTPGVGFVPGGQYPPTYNNRVGNDPAIPVLSFRIGGDAIDAVNGVRLGIGSNDETDWSTNLTDFSIITGPPGTVQQIGATDDQMTCAIPIPVDLTTNDKVVVSGTSYLDQDPTIAVGGLHVYIAQGTCDDTTDVTLLSEPEDADNFSYSSFVSSRRGGGSTKQNLCFRSEVNLQSAMTAGTDHLVVGFAFSGLNLPLTGVYTDLITINYNVFIIKNPS